MHSLTPIGVFQQTLFTEFQFNKVALICVLKGLLIQPLFVGFKNNSPQKPQKVHKSRKWKFWAIYRLPFQGNKS